MELGDIRLFAQSLFPGGWGVRVEVEYGYEYGYVRASEGTKAVWKWSAIPRTIRDQAATRAAPQKILKK